jgi:thymidylate kinase
MEKTMNEVTVKGDAGSGKTTIANAIKESVERTGAKAYVFDEVSSLPGGHIDRIREEAGKYDTIIFVENN